MSRTPLCLLALLLTAAPSLALSAESDQYGRGVTAWSAGDHARAIELFTPLIEDGSQEPLVYYFRGLSLLATGDETAARTDFAAGARQEVAAGSSFKITKALEHVQGPRRQMLETYRRDAQRQKELKAGYQRRDYEQQRIYAEARRAFFAGQDARTLELLDPLITAGSVDPRVYYFHGLALHRQGQTDQAAREFQQAVKIELSPGNQIDADQALEAVQGDLRRALDTHRQEQISALRLEERRREAAMIEKLLDGRASGSSAVAAIVRSANPAAIPAPTATPAPMPPTPPAPGANSATARAAGISLAWLPIDAELLIHIRVFDLWNSALVRPLHDREDVTMALAGMKQEFGLVPADVESVTVGMRAVAEFAQMAAVNPLGAAEGTQNVVMVIRTRLPFDPQVISRRTDDFEKADHNGTSFYRSLQPGTTPCVYVHDFRTLVFADEDLLLESIDAGPTPDPRPEFEFAAGPQQVTIAFVPTDPAALTAALPEMSGSPALDQFASAIRDQVLGASLGVTVSDGLDLEMRMLCIGSDVATEANAALNGLLTEAKGIWDLTRGALPTAVGGLVDSLIRSERHTARQDIVSVSTRLTPQSIERAVAAAQEMLPQLMMGLMAGGQPGLPPGVPPGAAPPVRPAAPAPMATRPAGELSMTATARISQQVDFNFDTGQQKPAAIELVLNITGEDAAKAGSHGFATIMTAQDNNGAALMLRDRSSGFGDPGYELIDRSSGSEPQPQNGCRVVLAFEPPATAPESIATLQGSLKLRVVEDSRPLVFDNVKSLLGQDLQHPDLAAAGFQFKLEEKTEKVGDEDVTQWTLSWVNADAAKLDNLVAGGGEGPQSPEIVAADGTVIRRFDGVSSSTFGAQASFEWSMTVSADQPVPDDAKLRMVLNGSVVVIDVPFNLKGVTIAP